MAAKIQIKTMESTVSVEFFRQEAFKIDPDYRFCSADTIARNLKKLAV